MSQVQRAQRWGATPDMTELLSGVETPSDAELISRVRGGDAAAYGELFSRHVEAARRLGRQLVRGPDADDLVSEAFAKTLQVLQGGGGPDVAFRAYLLTSVRRLHVDRIRAAKRVQPSDDMTVYDDGQPFQDTAVASFENGAAAKAFSSLPERWQLVLWHLEVEGQKPADIAPLLGMSANSVSALAYRAREGLRQAFLTMHLADCSTEECRWVNQHLGAYVRNGLSRRDTAKVQEHLDHCRRCTAMYLELSEVNSNLAGIIAPLLLGAAAAGYLSSGSAGLTGVSALIGRVRDAFAAESGGGGAAATSTTGASAAATGAAVTTGGAVATGGVVAAGVAAVATAALVLGGGGTNDVVTQAEKPGVVQTPTAGSQDGSPDARAGSPREKKGGDERSGSQDSTQQSGDVVVVAKIEPADTTGSGDASASSPGSTGAGGSTGTGDSGGQAPGSGSSGGDSGQQPAPGDGSAPNPAPQPQPEPDPGPGSGPIIPPVDLPDPLPDTPQVPSDDLPAPSLPENSIPGPSLPDKPLPGDPTGGGTGTTPDEGTGTIPDGGTGTTPDDGSGTTPDGGTGTTPDDGSGTTPDNGSGTTPDDGSGTTPDDGTGTTPDDGTGTTPDDSTGTTPDDSTGTTPGGGDTTAPEVTAVLSDRDGSGRPGKVLTVTVSGAPAGEIVLELVAPDGANNGSVRFTDSGSSCELDGAVATCAIDAGDHTLTFDVDIPPGQTDKTELKITFKDAEPAVVDWDPGTLPWPFTEPVGSD